MKVPSQICPALLLLFSSLLAWQTASAQLRPSESLSPEIEIARTEASVRSELARAEGLFSRGELDDALGLLQQLQDHPRSSAWFAPEERPDQFVIYRPLRDACRRMLTRWCRVNADCRRRYRELVSRSAEPRLTAAMAASGGGTENLPSLAQEYFLTRTGALALSAAAEDACVRGDFAAAREGWSQLHGQWFVSRSMAQEWKTTAGLPWYHALFARPLPAGNEKLPAAIAQVDPDDERVHPDSEIAPATVAANLIAVSCLEGDVRRARWELALFRRLYPEAEGRFGAKRGRLAELIEQWISENDIPSIIPTREWTTLSGDSARSGTVQLSELHIDYEKIASLELPRVSGVRDVLAEDRHRSGERHDALTGYHPILVKDELIICDGIRLQACDVRTGKWKWEVPLRTGELPSALTEQQVGVPRFTATAREGVVACVLPAPLTPVRRAPTVRQEARSRLVAIDLQSRRLVTSISVPDATWSFGGAPVIHHSRLYVLLYQLTDTRMRVSAACYDIASGREVWQRFLCAADTPGHGNLAEFTHGMLSLSHDRLYCNTNLGAVAAISVRDGSPLWLVRYPRATFPSPRTDRCDRHLQRDANPCLIYRDQIICLPADSERIFSLHALQGEMLWSTAPGEVPDVAFLAGARNDFIFAGGDALYWIEALSGQVVAAYPEFPSIGTGAALPHPRGWGRCVVTSAGIYWPTRDSIEILALQPERSGPFFLPQRVGQIDLLRHQASGGNLIVVEDGLSIATADRLHFLDTSGTTSKNAE